MWHAFPKLSRPRDQNIFGFHETGPPPYIEPNSHKFARAVTWECVQLSAALWRRLNRLKVCKIVCILITSHAFSKLSRPKAFPLFCRRPKVQYVLLTELNPSLNVRIVDLVIINRTRMLLLKEFVRTKLAAIPVRRNATEAVRCNARCVSVPCVTKCQDP